jgi:hypothetical protein
MKKRYLSVLIVVLILISIVFYLTLQSPYNSNEPQTQGDQTQEDKGFLGLPIFLPWQTKNETGTTGGGVTGGGGKAPGGGAPGTTAPRVINNFTLSVDSTHNLEVSIYYTFNDIAFNETKSLPFSLDVQGDTYACLSETTGSGTIRWLINNETDCPYSDCAGGIYGCNLLINDNYSIMLRQYS